MREFSGVMTHYLVLGVTQVYIIVEIHQIEHLRSAFYCMLRINQF